MEVFEAAADGWSYHVPDKIGEPVDDRLHSTDELQVLRFADALLDQEHDKAGRDKGHREDDTDGHEDVHGCGHPEKDSAAEGTIRAHARTHTRTCTRTRTHTHILKKTVQLRAQSEHTCAHMHAHACARTHTHTHTNV